MEQQLEQGPTLATIRMVERTLEHMEGSVITIAELKRKLPKQVHPYALKMILEYLEESRKIYVGIRGITWLHNPHPQMRAAIAASMEH